MNNNLVSRIKQTKDRNLLKDFPSFTRKELRDIKNGLDAPKILVFDIENSQMLVKVWQLRGNEYIEPKRIIKDWFVLCWSAKWLGDKEVLHSRLTGKEALKADDKRVVEDIWQLFDKAHIVIAHNGDRFDIAKLKARFLKHHLGLPSLYRSVDTLKIARKEFRLSSNKLDYICGYLGLDVKVDTGGIDLWDKCEAGDEKALEKMDMYCRNDVKILEELYIALRPYITNHPNLGVYLEGKVCNNCGSSSLKENGYHTTQSHKYITYKCKDCGAIIKSKEKYA